MASTQCSISTASGAIIICFAVTATEDDNNEQGILFAFLDKK